MVPMNEWKKMCRFAEDMSLRTHCKCELAQFKAGQDWDYPLGKQRLLNASRIGKQWASLKIKLG